uniref:WD_REPEATS_REGION domain-containing protein n=1 Tax=Caenorhabditis japonica TaxID=281687 RepID=A0A8R1DST0_CAEJA
MNDSFNADEDCPTPKAKIVGKYEKAHARSIVGVWSFRFGGFVGVMTIGHDAAKLWMLMDGPDDHVECDEKMVLDTWRSAVQSVEVTRDGNYAVIIEMNSIVHEIRMINSVDTTNHDFGYLEAVHVTIDPDKTNYVTSAYSGHLAKVTAFQEIEERKEAYPNVKSISCLKYSRDSKYLAIGQLDGAIEMLSTDTFKSFHKYEVHSMRIRKIEFLPNEPKFLSACDDRLIKLHSLVDFNEVDATRSTKALRVYSAHDAPVTGLTINEKSGGTHFASSSSSAQISALSFSPTGRHLISGGDDCILHVYSIPPTGDESPDPTDVQDSVLEEQDQEQQMTAESPYYRQGEEEPRSTDGQYQEPQSAEEEHYQPEQQYQEYRPYAEPRTPPQEDEDLGDFVYGQSESADQQYQQHTYEPTAGYQPHEYDPQA